MKQFKHLFTFILLIALSTTSFAQKTSLKENAEKLTTTLNKAIISSDASQTLSEDQKTKITAIHVSRLKELKIAKKEKVSKEEMKAINKKYYKQIFSEVLTKEQRLANKKGKEAGKEKK